jgi:hypothetical protein
MAVSDLLLIRERTLMFGRVFLAWMLWNSTLEPMVLYHTTLQQPFP